MSSAANVSAETLAAIRDEIVLDSSLFSERLKPEPSAVDTAGFADIFMAAAAGADAGTDDHLYALEYIFEGYLLHYGESRLLRPDEDDFQLLAGDYMYARGLNHTAAIGDLFYIRALASLIEFCSYLHCGGMDTRLALNAWAVVSLCMADRASSCGDRDPGCRPAFESFTAAAWGTSLGAGGLDDMLEDMLASREQAARREIENLLEKVRAEA